MSHASRSRGARSPRTGDAHRHRDYRPSGPGNVSIGPAPQAHFPPVAAISGWKSP
jgi:hypothetical protein